MKSLFLALTAAICWAHQAVILTSGSGAVTISGAPYSTLQTWQIDGRVYSWTMPVTVGAVAPIWNGAGGITVGIANVGGVPQLQLQDFYDTSASCCGGINITGYTDIAWRLRKSAANLALTLEVWNLSNSGATLYQLFTLPITVAGAASTGTLTVGSVTAKLVFLRWYSTLVPLNSTPPFGGSGGDLGDWEFAGNGNDSSTHANNLTMSGVTYDAAAPTYPPACIMPPQQSIRAGFPTNFLTSAGSFPLDNTNALTSVSWSQIPGNITITPPSTLIFSPNTSATNPTLTGFVAGSYTIQQTITQSIGSPVSCSQKYGSVPVDSRGNVIISNVMHNITLGPMPATFTNTYPFMEGSAASYANVMLSVINGAGIAIAPYNYFPSWNTAATGTIAITGTAVTGVGTGFLSLYCGGSAGSAVSIPNSGGDASPFMIVWAPITGFGLPGGTTDRYIMRVASCASNTSLTLTTSWTGSAFLPSTIAAGTQFSYGDNNSANATNSLAYWQSGSAPVNYYDCVMALYAQFYRTGIDDYFLAAQNLADSWFSSPAPGIDKGVIYDGVHGALQLQPRSLALAGLIMRTNDTVNPPPYSYWPGIWAVINNLIGNTNYVPVSDTLTTSDLRDQSYVDIFLALCALDSTSGHQAACRSALSGDMTHRWTYQLAHGVGAPWLTLINNTASWNGGGFTATPTTGSASVTASGGTWTSGWFPGTAPYTPIMFTNSGTSVAPPNSTSPTNTPWDSVYYCAKYVDATHINLVDCTSGSTVNYAGSQSGTNAGWEIGFSLGPQLNYGVEIFYIGINNRAFYYTTLALASADPTNAALAKSYALLNTAYVNQKGINPAEGNGLFYARIYTNCEPAGCNAGSTSTAVILNGEGTNIGSSLLLSPGDATSLAVGNILQNTMWNCTGIYASTCLVATQLLNQTSGFFLSKWFGYYWGISANWMWPGILDGIFRPGPVTGTGVMSGSSIAELRRAHPSVVWLAQ